jgi:hypothetical protein
MSDLDSLIASGLKALVAGRQVFDSWLKTAWPLDVFRSLALSPPEETPYARLVLAESPAGEAMLATWRAGGKSVIHDHGDADGAVIVLVGDFIETQFQFRAGNLREGKSLSYSPGMVARVTNNAIHDMHAPQGGLTLHLYAAGPLPVCLFDPDLRRTVILSSAAGAWLPARKEDVLGIKPWQGS